MREDWVVKLFRELHGAFGARWSSLWATGTRGADGQDTGMANAQAVWARKLAGFAEQPHAIAHALRIAQEQPHPPSLGEFLGWCRTAPRPIVPMLRAPRGEQSPEVRACLEGWARKARMAGSVGRGEGDEVVA